MASRFGNYFGDRSARFSASTAPQIFDFILAAVAAMLLVAVAMALFKGYGTWDKLPANVWAHIVTITIALALTPVMLLRRRGDTPHRVMGWIWASSLILTALISFSVRFINNGSFSFIHLLSAWTLIQVPVLVISARRHDVTRHRSAVRGIVTGALLIAGFFTFPFDRVMGQWLFG